MPKKGTLWEKGSAFGEKKSSATLRGGEGVGTPGSVTSGKIEASSAIFAVEPYLKKKKWGGGCCATKGQFKKPS